MSISFIFGPAGSGKSTYVRDMLIKEAKTSPKKDFLLIVPDQFTMQTQMDIVKAHPDGGILNIDVLSFGRLSYRVFSVTGKSDKPILDDTGKSLVIRKVAGQVRDKMPYMGRNLNKIGFIHEVKSSISEFMQYGLSVKDVTRLADSLPNGVLKSKLKDLSVIYEAFSDYNRDKFITGEETMDLLCEKLPDADFIKGSVIVFDGFTGFTPIQERVIHKLMTLAEKVVFTFDLSTPEVPSLVGGEEKLFYLSRKSAKRLKTAAEDMGVEVLDDVVLSPTDNPRFKNAPELNHIEKYLFRYPVTKFSDPKNLSVFSCKNIESEVSEICLRIHELVRTEGYAYRDIAVITGDLQNYGMYFENIMRELEMPAFIDKTRGIILNPFTEYLKSALLIFAKDFSYDAVFHYLRSGFTDFTEEETDRFDRYVTSLNIRGKSTYSKPFKRKEKGIRDKALAEEELSFHNSIRERLMNELAVLDTEARTAGDYVRNLYSLLKNKNSYEKLEAYKARFEEENDLPKATEYGQIYKCIMELLDTIDSLLHDEEMDIEEFYRIFEAGISEIEVGTIPRNVDRVVVGDIERTRIGEVKALFFAGVNDTNIPKSGDKGGILSGTEREMLLSQGWDLAPSPREEMYTQRLYLYMNMCKPTDRLFVSFCGTDTEGKGLRPSYLIDVLTSMFDGLKVENIEITPDISRLVTVKESLSQYSVLLRKYVAGSLDDAGEKLLKALMKEYKDEAVSLTEEIEDSAFVQYVATPLSREIVRLIYGNTINASISRMETYAGCAYSHFLKYGMRLKVTEEYGFEASDLGTIYHGVLDRFSSELERNNISWADFSKEDGEAMVEQAVRAYCEDYEQGLLSDDEQNAYTVEKINRIMKRTVDTLQFQLKRGHFKPESHEYSFKREIPLDGDTNLLLNGTIDRVDLYEQDNRIYVKILDYKSSSKDIDVTDIYHGIQQQLAFYMAEAVHREQTANPDKEVIPGALLYYTIDNPMLSNAKKTSIEMLESAIRDKLKPKGIVEDSEDNIRNLDDNAMGDASVLPVSFNKDGSVSKRSAGRVFSREEMNNLLNYVERMVINIGKRINDGDKRISPMRNDKSDACKFCDFKSICRFDEKIPGYTERDGKEIDKETATGIVFGGNSDELYLFE
ncbi:MAG: PD-(D/E)XK nuclease family protein [Lachnospiraceae bacterium]|nr:PD-(D/E)XK nuclease family protein [Lachnospiraceae bacterium]